MGGAKKKKTNYSDEFNDWKYSIRGKTIDGRSLRRIVALEESEGLVITAIDLDSQGDEVLD